MNYRELYDFAYSYLLEKDKVTEEIIKIHLKPHDKYPKDINTILKRLLKSACTKQMYPNVIGNIEKLNKVLFNFNPNKITKKYSDLNYRNLFDDLRASQVSNNIKDSTNSIWFRFSKTILQGALFLSKFKTSKDFYSWISNFMKNEDTKIALPLFIGMEISGMGFALSCDFLKELGFKDFGKPDVHIMDIFHGLSLIDPNEKNKEKQIFQAFKILKAIAIENNISVYEVDRVFWLIGSGNFFLCDIKIRNCKNDFILKAKKHLGLD